MFDLHRHDEYSSFDGFGKASELAKLAKELGYESLCTTNHGNTNGLVQTYDACKVEGLKAILGCEGYFLPKWKEKTRGKHLIVVAKDIVGYGNLNRIQLLGEQQKYYQPIWDFDMLEKHHDGLICCSACIAGYSAQAIIAGRDDLAEKFFKKMKHIFEDDFYVEIQPYAVSEEGLQEKVNVKSIELARKLGIKCILTSDSHRGRKEDFESYLKMHEIAGHDTKWIAETYKDRYMPEKDEMAERFVKMHSDDFGKSACIKMADSMYSNLDSIEDKCVEGYLDDLPLKLPKLGDNSVEKLKHDIFDGLKARGKFDKEYKRRCKEEFDVIKFHGFEDYFLIVADYVNWAKDSGIRVGPGRGSVCNSLVAYALGITEVDSLSFGLDFRRFLREDKNSLPDIDIDFETSRRHDVIEYICKKYEGHAARICSYGLYRVDNLVNDLAKSCGLATSGDVSEEEKKANKVEIASIKSCVRRFLDDDGAVVDEAGMAKDQEAKLFNERYDNIMTHFCKLFKKVKFIGTHAAGVAITGGKLLDYCALRVDKNGDMFTSYDLEDVESVNVIKFDVLGLKTMESIGNLRDSTGVTVDYDSIVNDEKLMEQFCAGRTDGVFQFDRNAARGILSDIHCDCFADVVAADAMNRPGPLSLGMPAMYAQNKMDSDEAKSSIWWEYTESSYGTIIYQEQVQQICIGIAGLSWGDADKIMKMMKGGHMTESAWNLYIKNRDNLQRKFVKGAVSNGYSRDVAKDLFDKMTTYTFNAGHATGYSLISVEEMYYKVYYPNDYWFAKIKFASSDSERAKFCAIAVRDGAVLFLPHVNWSDANAKLMKHDGDVTIQQGMSELKGVGEKAANYIVAEREANGIFRSYDDFYDRCKSRVVTSRVIDILLENGAIELDKNRYIKRVTKYNSSLFARSS